MSAPTPCLVVAYSYAGEAVAFWQAEAPGQPGKWTTDPAQATAMPTDEAALIAGMWQDYATAKASWTRYSHAAASNYR